MITSDLQTLHTHTNDIAITQSKIEAISTTRKEQVSSKPVLSEKELRYSQESFHVLKELHPWKLANLSRDQVSVQYSHICAINFQLGVSLQKGGREVKNSAILFNTTKPSNRTFVSGIPLEVVPQAREWVAVLLQTRKARDQLSSLKESSQISSLLFDFSTHYQRSLNLIREIYYLQIHHNLPYLVQVNQNDTNLFHQEEADPLIAKVTFLRHSDWSRSFEISFGLSSQYPFGPLRYHLSGLRVDDPLCSHVQEIIRTASAGHTGTGCKPITSVCEALVEFIGSRG
jgi:hypothetical protein